MSDATKKDVTDALLAHWRDTSPPEETMLASRILIVAEVIDSDGDEILRVSPLDETPAWTRLGMLAAAQRCVQYELDSGWGEVDD